MRTGLTSLFIITALLTACGAPAATSQAVSTQAPIISSVAYTATIAPTDTLVTATATETPTSTPTPSPRWYWAIQKNEILAFNAAGKVHSILDLSSIQQEGNDMAPVRLGEDRAFMFFDNNGSPKAFLLTSDSAAQIKLPAIQVPFPGNPWNIHMDSYPYIVIEAEYGAIVPAILINGENGQASLIATNVFVGYSYSEYYVRLSADGRSLRYAAGEEPVAIYNRDLQSGKDTLILQSSGYISTDAFGEAWYDSRQGIVQLADGQAGSLATSDANTRHLLLDNGWMLDSQRTCKQPCPLKVYPVVGSAIALNYSLPVNLDTGQAGSDARLVFVNYGKILEDKRLLVAVYDQNDNNSLREFWLLAPDGTGTLVGNGRLFSGKLAGGSSPGGPYVLIYPTDAKSEFRLFDTATEKVLFSEATGTTDVFIDMLFFPEGVIIQELDDTAHDWVYHFATGLATPLQSLGENTSCMAITPDGRPVCVKDDSVRVYDPVSGDNTELIQGPVTRLSN